MTQRHDATAASDTGAASDPGHRGCPGDLGEVGDAGQAGDARQAGDANPIETFLTYRLTRTSWRLSAQASRMLRDAAGLSLTQWRVITLIGPDAERTLSGIARQAGFDKGQLSRCAKGLTAAGLIAARPHPEDQRQSLLHLTAEGRALFDRLLPIMQRRQARLMDCLSPDQRALIFPLLDRLSEAADRTEFTPDGPTATPIAESDGPATAPVAGSDGPTTAAIAAPEGPAATR
ncbi:MAG: MarR family transcriptional regulator [Pseudomonadota bacterium]